MKLKELHDLLHGVEIEEIKGGIDSLSINKIQVDSRLVEKGDLFVALRGTRFDGHTFLENVLDQGAGVVVLERFPSELREGVVYIKVNESEAALGMLASNYYGNPSSKFKLVGVTGTNGKTTIATLLYDLFVKLGYKAGLLSTIENKVGEKVYPTIHTTPDLLSMNALMAEMVKEGCDYVAMEVSSHAIDQKRIAGLDFDGGIFTNLTAEHLDYHRSFKEYVYTKKKFFDLLKPEAFALINADDKNGLVMLQNSKANHKSYALKRMADYKGLILSNSLQGLHMKLNQTEAFFKLIGHFNAYNLLAVYGSALLLGFEEEEVIVNLSVLSPANGRFEIIYHPELDVTAIIDYAHTADALENVLRTINDLKEEKAKVIALAGAGGDRDKSKRPEMGRVAFELSDTLILTSDNPRTEDPGQIVSEMMEGIEKEKRKEVMTVLDRAEAIRVATKIASKGDIILIAGKGHENYQEIMGVRRHFDDKEILKNIWF